MYLNVKEVAARFAISTSTVWGWVRAGIFPKPTHVGPHTRRWLLEDVDRWEQERREN
jgi:predicted DNA-binding transcriptional regulator AlpA